MAIPTTSTEWGSAAPLTIQPTSVMRARGFDTDSGTEAGIPERPTLQHMNAWMTNVDEWVEYIKAIVAAGQTNQFIVGSIEESILNEVDFQTETDTTWVAMNGQDVTGSEYATITGNTTVPNASGRFLRMVGGDSLALGILQTDSAAINGLGGTASGQSYVGNSASVSSDAHNHSWVYQSRDGSNYFGDPQPSRIMGLAGISNGNPFTFTTDNHTHNHTQSISHTHAASSVTIDADAVETRPLNISLNYYIKID